MARRVSVKVEDRDRGFKKLAASLGDMGKVSLGVQGKEATQPHWSGRTTIGHIAAAHELGKVPGAPARSWLRTWMDQNEERMRREAAREFALVMTRRKTRNKALVDMGYQWTKELRDNIDQGKITPPLAESTKRRKGHGIPLLERGELRDAITYKVWLPHKRSIKDRAQRAVVYGK